MPETRVVLIAPDGRTMFDPPGRLLEAAPLIVEGTTAPVAQHIAGRQPKDATLTALAALATAADRIIYATGVDTFALSTLTAFARTLLAAPGDAEARAGLNLGSAALLSAGQPGGAATLDGSTGKLLSAQIPDALLGAVRYQGGWNASTNSPALPAPASANKGFYYIVTVAGATSQPGPNGAITDWQIGDWAVSDGTYWEKVDSSDQVVSVAGLQGAITAAALKAALAVAAADITDASANGRSLIKAADYAAVRALLSLNSTASVSFRNRIRNGDFSINQRNVSGTVSLTSAVTNTYGHDGWKVGSGGSTSYTFSTTGGVTTLNVTAGTLAQIIEGGLYLLEGGSYTLSWAGTAQARINGGSYSASPLTITGLSAGANATIEFSTGTVALVQFEPGTFASPFERRDDELRRNQRYYERLGRGLPGSTGNSSFITVPLRYCFPKRATPTLRGLLTSLSANSPGVATYSNSAATYDFGQTGADTTGAVAFIGGWSNLPLGYPILVNNAEFIEASAEL